MDGDHLLEAVAGTKGNSTICEALVTQQSVFIDTILRYFRLSEINGFDSNTQIISNSII